MTYKDLLSNPRYRNWVKAGLGFKFLKEGLESFVDNEVRGLRDAFLQDICINLGINEASCTNCTTANTIPCPTYRICNVRRGAGICSFHDRSNQSKASRQCPNQICNTIHQKIINQHQYNIPSWKNTDARQWCTSPWQIAKCYMPLGGYENKNSVTETDCSGILNVIINCLHLHNGLDTGMGQQNNICARILNMRNEVFHSATLELTDDELTSLINEMTNLLQDKKKLLNDTGAQTAVVKLTELKDGAFNISTTDELEIHKATLNAIKDLTEETKQFATDIEKKQTEVEGRQRLVEEKQADADTWQNIVEKKQADAETRQNIVEKKQADAESRQNIVENKQADFDTRQHVFERKQDDLQKEIMKLHMKLDNIRGIKDRHQQNIEYLERKKELQDQLCRIYDDHLSTIPVSPVLPEIKAELDDVFAELVICNDLVHEPKKLEKRLDTGEKVKGYRDVLYKQDQKCKNVYVIADAGMGKTTWCMNLLSSWVKVFKKTTGQNLDLDNSRTPDEKTLSEFHIVLFASLRHLADCGNILDMLTRQLLSEHPHLVEITEEVLKKEPQHCLVVLDGLDEWSPPDNFKSCSFSQHPGLPGRGGLHECTVLTTTRPWKLDAIRKVSIDRAVKIQGIQNPYLLVQKIIEFLNRDETEKINTKKAEDFKKNIIELFNEKQPSFLDIPLIIMFMVCIWLEEGTLESTLAGNYSGLLELLIINAQRDEASGKPGRLSVPNLQDLKNEWVQSASSLPKCLKNRTNCKYYSKLLLTFSKLAFDALFDSKKENNLVFTMDSLQNKILPEELDVAVKIGLLSQTRAAGTPFKRKTSLSFLHKSVQEYLAALHLVCNTQSGNCEALDKYKHYCTFWVHVQEMENVLMFVCGMNPKVASKMSKYIYEAAILKNIPAGSPDLSNHYIPQWHFLQWAWKYINEISVAHGDIYPSTDYPFHYGYRSIILNLYHRKTYKLEINLLKTNRAHIKDVTINIYDKVIPNSYKEIVCLLSEELQQPNNMVESFSLQSTPFLPEVKPLLSKAIPQMGKLRKLELHSVHLPDTASETVMDLSCCKHLEEFVCSNVDHIKVTFNQKMLKLIQLQNVSMFSLYVQIGKSNGVEKIICTNSTNCSLDFTNTFMDACNEQVQCSSKDNIVHIGTMDLQTLTKCKVHFGSGVQLDTLFVTGDLNMFSVSFQPQSEHQSILLPGMVSLFQNMKMVFTSKQSNHFPSADLMSLISFTKLNISASTASNLNTYVYKQNEKVIHLIFTDSKTSMCEVSAAYFHQTNIEVLSLTGNSHAEFLLTIQDLQHLTKLRHLICEKLSKLVCEELWKVLPTLTQLEKLDLTYLHDSISRSVVQSYKHLTNLHHVKCAHIGNTFCKVLGEILQQLPQLMTLEVDKAEITHAPHNSSDGNSVSRPVIQSYKHLTNLHHVKCAHIGNTACKVLGEILQQLPQLKTLEVDRFDIIPTSQHLTNLTCEMSSNCDYEVLWNVLPTMKQLEKLDLLITYSYSCSKNSESCSKISESTSVIQSYKHLTNLQHVKCADIDNTACKLLGQIFQQLPQLKTLEVDRADIIPSSQQLIHLTCENISGGFDCQSHVLAKQLSKLTQLETLQLYTCKVEEFNTHGCFTTRMIWKDEDAESVIQTLQFLQNLRHLTLNIDWDDWSLTRSPVDHRRDTLLHSLKKLTKLEILELKLGSESIFLSQLCNLKKITFNLCKYLDNGKWKELLDNLPKQHPNHNLEVTINHACIEEHTKEYVEKLTRFPSQQWCEWQDCIDGKKSYKKVILQEEDKEQ